VNNLLDNTDEEEEYQRPRRSVGGRDREITLGTTMILLIFFALAVYGAAFFGFGYSLGSKRNGSGAVAAAPGSSSSFSASKPAPGSPIGAAYKVPVVDNTPVPFTPPVKTTSPTVVTADTSEPDEPKSKPATPPSAPVATATPSATAPPGTGPAMVVQVAAVSHQEDAELIASTLQRRGYAVNIRTEPDKLLHVQVGPFYSRKDAETMKARLLADGFNAYIK
jgi:DedD protein